MPTSEVVVSLFSNGTSSTGRRKLMLNIGTVLNEKLDNIVRDVDGLYATYVKYDNSGYNLYLHNNANLQKVAKELIWWVNRYFEKIGEKIAIYESTPVDFIPIQLQTAEHRDLYLKNKQLEISPGPDTVSDHIKNKTASVAVTRSGIDLDGSRQYSIRMNLTHTHGLCHLILKVDGVKSAGVKHSNKGYSVCIQDGCEYIKVIQDIFTVMYEYFSSKSITMIIDKSTPDKYVTYKFAGTSDDRTVTCPPIKVKFPRLINQKDDAAIIDHCEVVDELVKLKDGLESGALFIEGSIEHKRLMMCINRLRHTQRKPRKFEGDINVTFITFGNSGAMWRTTVRSGATIMYAISQLECEERFYNNDGYPIYEYRINYQPFNQESVIPAPNNDKPVVIICSMPLKIF